LKTTSRTGSKSSRSSGMSGKRPQRESFDFGEDRRVRYLAGMSIDYKNGELLKRFMTEQGKIMPRRITGATAKQQRQLKQAISRARTMGLVR
jgi:small subunit ribosomal protein S18